MFLGFTARGGARLAEVIPDRGCFLSLLRSLYMMPTSRRTAARFWCMLK